MQCRCFCRQSIQYDEQCYILCMRGTLYSGELLLETSYYHIRWNACKNSDNALSWFKKFRKSYAAHLQTIQCSFQQPGWSNTLVTHSAKWKVNSAQKLQHTPHIMSHGTPTSTPAKDSTSHTMDMILYASEHTPTCRYIMPVKKPTIHNSPVYCKTTSSPDSELHAPLQKYS